MKIIHTADIHLDSKMNGRLDPNKAKQRKAELITTFKNMVDYAAKEGVAGIIIAGDLFDVSRISATARNAVIDAINENGKITFFYLRGNHDANGFVQDVIAKNGSLPENLKLFSDEWTSYTLSDDVDVVITGAELNSENNARLVSTLVLDQSSINIVTLHGQEVELASKNDAEIIPLREYRNRGIDYMALGHIHMPKIEKLDARGYFSYSGCLEGRGFDECGPRGFNLLTITDGHKLEVEFIPFAKRVVYELSCDISECLTSDEVIRVIREAANEAEVLSEDMLRAVLVGELSLDADVDVDYIEHSLKDDYYVVSVKDKTGTRIEYENYIYDKTLKGQFVRMVMEDKESGKLSPEEAEKIIRMGVSLLTGEEALR